MRTFKEIAEEMVSLQERKNADYGNAFAKSCDKWGLIASIVRIGDKVNRIESIFKNDTLQVKSESIKDTLIDLAAYALMTVEWLDEKEQRSTQG